MRFLPPEVSRSLRRKSTSLKHKQKVIRDLMHAAVGTEQSFKDVIVQTESENPPNPPPNRDIDFWDSLCSIPEEYPSMVVDDEQK